MNDKGERGRSSGRNGKGDTKIEVRRRAKGIAAPRKLPDDVHTAATVRDKLDAELLDHEQTRARLAAIVSSSEDAIVSKDLNGIITTWNDGAERLFGYTADEVVGKSVTILIPDDHIDEEPRILERIRRGGIVDHYETIRRRKDGSLVEISLTVSPLRDASGTIIGASKIARDITKGKAIDAALRAKEAELQTIADTTPLILVRCSRDLT